MEAMQMSDDQICLDGRQTVVRFVDEPVVYNKRLDGEKWEQLQPVIYQLNQEGKTRQEIISVLKSEHDTVVTLNQLTRKMNGWGYKPISRSNRSSISAYHDLQITQEVEDTHDVTATTVVLEEDINMEGAPSDSKVVLGSPGPTAAAHESLPPLLDLFPVVKEIKHAILNISDLNLYDRYGILNDVAYFFKASGCSFAAFDYFSSCHTRLSTHRSGSLQLASIVSAINCRQTATGQDEIEEASDFVRSTLHCDSYHEDDSESSTKKRLESLAKACHLSWFDSGSEIAEISSTMSRLNMESLFEFCIERHLARWCDPFLINSEQTLFFEDQEFGHLGKNFFVRTLAKWCLQHVQHVNLRWYVSDSVDMHFNYAASEIVTVALACLLVRQLSCLSIPEMVSIFRTQSALSKVEPAVEMFKSSIQVLFVISRWIVSTISVFDWIYPVDQRKLYSVDRGVLIRRLDGILLLEPCQFFEEFSQTQRTIADECFSLRRDFLTEIQYLGGNSLGDYIMDTANKVADAALRVQNKPGVYYIPAIADESTKKDEVTTRKAKVSMKTGTSTISSVSVHSGESEDMRGFRQTAKRSERLYQAIKSSRPILFDTETSQDLLHIDRYPDIESLGPNYPGSLFWP